MTSAFQMSLLESGSRFILRNKKYRAAERGQTVGGVLRRGFLWILRGCIQIPQKAVLDSTFYPPEGAEMSATPT
jgi:hypothetical protein